MAVVLVEVVVVAVAAEVVVVVLVMVVVVVVIMVVVVIVMILCQKDLCWLGPRNPMAGERQTHYADCAQVESSIERNEEKGEKKEVEREGGRSWEERRGKERRDRGKDRKRILIQENP